MLKKKYLMDQDKMIIKLSKPVMLHKLTEKIWEDYVNKMLNLPCLKLIILLDKKPIEFLNVSINTINNHTIVLRLAWVNVPKNSMMIIKQIIIIVNKIQKPWNYYL